MTHPTNSPPTAGGEQAGAGGNDAAGNGAGMTGMQKFIFVCEPFNMILAQRAAKYLLDRPETKSAICAYGQGKDEVIFYIRRTKASLIVRQEP
jgi:hypothetical protein